MTGKTGGEKKCDGQAGHPGNISQVPRTTGEYEISPFVLLPQF